MDEADEVDEVEPQQCCIEVRRQERLLLQCLDELHDLEVLVRVQQQVQGEDEVVRYSTQVRMGQVHHLLVHEELDECEVQGFR